MVGPLADPRAVQTAERSVDQKDGWRAGQKADQTVASKVDQ